MEVVKARSLALAAAVLAACIASAAEPSDPYGWRTAQDIPFLPREGEPELVIQKLRPADGRYVRGFLLTPLDGRVDSWSYNGTSREWSRDDDWYYHPACYRYLSDPGYHVTLADPGFNYLVVRGGFGGDMYEGVDADNGPGRGRLAARLASARGSEAGPALAWCRRTLQGSVPSGRVSFFWRGKGADLRLADIGFFRLGAACRPVEYDDSIPFEIGGAAAVPPDLSPYLRRRFGDADHRVIHLSPAGAEGRKPHVLLAAQPAHLVTPVLPKDTPIGAVRLQLEIAGVAAGNRLLIVAQDPLNRNQELMRMDLAMKAAGSVRCVLDFPDQVMPAARLSATMKPATGGTPAPNWPALTGDATPEGRRFWLTLVSEHGGTLTPASQVVLLKPPMAVADAASRSYRLLMLKAYFGMLSEARPWMSLTPAVSFEQMAAQRGSYEGPLLELHETLCELFRRHPDEKAVQWTWGWVHQNWLSPHAWPGAGSPHYDRIKREEVPDLLGVPRWAMLQNRLARSAAEVVNWWIERRRASNGEFGGTVNDDTCLMPWFLVPALVDSRLIEPARESSRGVMELAIRHGLDRGLCRRDTDYGHGYEDGINQTALMLAMDYGNPRYVEQAMLASRSLAQVTPMTPGGFRRFVPHDSRKEFGARLLDRPPPADPDWWKKPEPDNTTSAVNFHPMLLLAWYNRHPLAIRVLEEYGTGTEQWRRCGGYNSGPHFAFGLYWLTRRPEYMIARIEKGFRLNLDWDGAACDYVTHTPELRGHPDWPKARQAYGWDVLQLGWAVTQDRKVLERALEQSLWGRPGHWAAGGFDLFRHILTEAEMFDDRIFLYQNGLLGQTYLGGYMYRNKYWPSMAVSWDGLEEAFGALVLESGEERLKVAVVNLRETPRGGKMRAWQLRHGLYEVLTGPDENDDGVMDSVQSRETLELQRMDSAVNVELPPRKVMIYEARLVEALDRIEDRADPAIGPEDVVVRDDRIEATVHNLGIQPARQVRLALLDVQNVVLASAVVEDLEAPLDFIPRRKTVSFPRYREAFRVVVDPQERIPDLTRLNNAARVPPAANGGAGTTP